MKTTFFDFIGTADMERIHSATIAWMISDQCGAFTPTERSSLLECLFGSRNSDIVQIKVCNEFEHIDIALITEDSNKNKEIWVIENKIKAPLAHNQLKKYEGIFKKNSKKNPKIEELNKIRYDYTRKHFSVLSLIGTLPQDYKGDWHTVTYSELLDVLNPICDKDRNENQHFIIIKEYRDCIQNLVNALKEFDVHPQNYPNVFTDGNKSKKDKIESNIYSFIPFGNNISLEDYISINGLETLFQKSYFVNIISEIYSDDRYKGIVERCHVSETHGNADFAFHFRNNGFNDKFEFDLSFQNGTFKFAVSEKGYPKFKKGDKDEDQDKDEDKEKFLNEWKNSFDSIVKSIEFFNYNRLNLPKSRARISVSCNMGPEWYKDKNSFIRVVRSHVDEAYNMMNYIIQRKNILK